MIGVRNILYDRGILGVTSVGCPVISVGNITTGGTGKTPFVEFLVSHFLERGAKTALLSRGYGRSSGGTVTVSDGVSLLCGADMGGDEAVQVARKYPRCVVVVDADRVRGARHVVEKFSPDVILLDDGFQHRALHRDLDIVVLDGSRDFASMPMLPAGHRREPLSALRRAHFFIRNRFDPGSPDAPGTGADHRTASAEMRYRLIAFRSAKTGGAVGIDRLRAETISAFCGIGNPRSFRSLLEGAGIRPAAFMEFPDHHRYTADDFSGMSETANRSGSSHLVTTEKDAVRIGRIDAVAGTLADRVVYAVIGAELTSGKERLIAAVDAAGAVN